MTGVDLLWPGWLLPAGLALVDWYAVARRDRRTETWAKPLVLLTLLGAAAVQGAGDEAAGRWLMAGLAFGLLGDVALLSDSLRRFVAGVAAFLAGHLSYLVCFVLLGLAAPAWSWAGVGVALAALVVTRGVVPATHRVGGRGVSVPVAAYSVVIGAMLVLAWLTGEPWVAVGATVFVASDTILSVDRFVRRLPHAALALTVTYHVGQAILVLGVLGALAA